MTSSARLDCFRSYSAFSSYTNHNKGALRTQLLRITIIVERQTMPRPSAKEIRHITPRSIHGLEAKRMRGPISYIFPVQMLTYCKLVAHGAELRIDKLDAFLARLQRCVPFVVSQHVFVLHRRWSDGPIHAISVHSVLIIKLFICPNEVDDCVACHQMRERSLTRN